MITTKDPKEMNATEAIEYWKEQKLEQDRESRMAQDYQEDLLRRRDKDQSFDAAQNPSDHIHGLPRQDVASGPSLLPCPFCGKEPGGQEFGPGPYIAKSAQAEYYTVICSGCCSSATCSSPENVINKWNTRASSHDALTAARYGQVHADDLPSCRCGGRPDLFQVDNVNRRWFIECLKCGINTPHDGFGDPVQVWDRVMTEKGGRAMTYSDAEQHKLDEQSGRELDAHAENLKRWLEAGCCPKCRTPYVLEINPKNIAFKCVCGWFAIYPIATIGNSSPLHAENDALKKEVEQLKAALNFCGDLTNEEVAYASVGTGAEVALRHIARRAREAREAAEVRNLRQKKGE